MDKIKSQKIVFFAKNDNLEVLNKAVSYVQSNELTKWLKVPESPRTRNNFQTLNPLPKRCPRRLCPNPQPRDAKR